MISPLTTKRFCLNGMLRAPHIILTCSTIAANNIFVESILLYSGIFHDGKFNAVDVFEREIMFSVLTTFIKVTTKLINIKMV